MTSEESRIRHDERDYFLRLLRARLDLGGTRRQDLERHFRDLELKDIIGALEAIQEEHDIS